MSLKIFALSRLFAFFLRRNALKKLLCDGQGKPALFKLKFSEIRLLHVSQSRAKELEPLFSIVRIGQASNDVMQNNFARASGEHDSYFLANLISGFAEGR